MQQSSKNSQISSLFPTTQARRSRDILCLCIMSCQYWIEGELNLQRLFVSVLVEFCLYVGLVL